MEEKTQKREKQRKAGRYGLVFIFLLLLLFFFFIWNVNSGSVSLSVGEIIDIIFMGAEMRLPAVLSGRSGCPGFWLP